MKKVIEIGIVLILSMSLIACKSSTSDSTIKIGVTTPNTGQLATYGQSVTNAIKLAIKEINDDGGVLNKQIAATYLDDKGDSTEGGNTFNRLISDGNVAVIGSVTSGVTSGLTTIADSTKMLLITPTATNDDITPGHPTVFRACYADSYQSAVVAQFMAKTLNVKKVGILYASGDAYSAGMYAGFKAAAKELGLEVVAEESTSGISDTDFNTQWAKLAQSGAEAVFAPFYYDSVGPYIVPQARSAGFKGAIVGADGWDGTAGTMVTDKSLYNNTYFTNHYAADDPAPAVQNFVASYKAAYGEVPNALAALAYDSVYMIKQAIETAKSAKTADIVAAMTGMTFSGVTGNFTLDSDNTPQKPCAIIEFKDGEMVWKDTVGV